MGKNENDILTVQFRIHRFHIHMKFATFVVKVSHLSVEKTSWSALKEQAHLPE